MRLAGSDLSLRVSTRPYEVFEVGAKVWLELDPQQLVGLSPAQTVGPSWIAAASLPGTRRPSPA